jgi:dTDP-4-dehydrorhamnose 3,5-epimerase
MVLTKCAIPGLLIFEPRVFEDERGLFFESYNEREFCKIVGNTVKFCQDNESLSHKHVLRGLHFQNPPYSQGKMVRVSCGSVLDVAVDLRRSSPFYGQYHSILLSAENRKQFWIPPGFAHGFLALEDNTVFNYKCTNYYSPVSESAIQWNDPTLKINWPVAHPIVSEKDQNAGDFVNFVSQFD